MSLDLCLGENSKDVGHMAGEGLSKGPKEANPEDLAAVSPVQTFLGTSSHCGCLNICRVSISYLHSEYKTVNTHYLVHPHQSPRNTRDQSRKMKSFLS